jgi:YD repeat-containing protein
VPGPASRAHRAEHVVSVTRHETQQGALSRAAEHSPARSSRACHQLHVGERGAETYTYNANGQRVKKVTADGTTQYLWDRQNVLHETDASLAAQVQYL